MTTTVYRIQMPDGSGMYRSGGCSSAVSVTTIADIPARKRIKPMTSKSISSSKEKTKVIDPDEVAELRSEMRMKACSTRCQCDVEDWGTCPGPTNCPYSGDNEGEEDDES